MALPFFSLRKNGCSPMLAVCLLVMALCRSMPRATAFSEFPQTHNHCRAKSSMSTRNKSKNIRDKYSTPPTLSNEGSNSKDIISNSRFNRMFLFKSLATVPFWTVCWPAWSIGREFPAELDTTLDGEINNVKTIAEQPQLLEIFGFVYSDVWATLLWTFVLFFGLSENGRPADWIAERIAGPLGLGGQWLEDQEQGLATEKPLLLLVLLQVMFLGLGAATVQAILLFFDSDHFWPWSFGACAAIGSLVYEIGRPNKLTKEESEVAEKQWDDFLLFASEKLQRKGACHQSKVITAFRRYYAQYRTEEQISTIELERLIRRWHSGEPPRQGFYRGLSLQEAAATTMNKDLDQDSGYNNP